MFEHKKNSNFDEICYRIDTTSTSYIPFEIDLTKLTFSGLSDRQWEIVANKFRASKKTDISLSDNKLFDLSFRDFSKLWNAISLSGKKHLTIRGHGGNDFYMLNEKQWSILAKSLHESKFDSFSIYNMQLFRINSKHWEGQFCQMIANWKGLKKFDLCYSYLRLLSTSRLKVLDKAIASLKPESFGIFADKLFDAPIPKYFMVTKDEKRYNIMGEVDEKSDEGFDEDPYAILFKCHGKSIKFYHKRDEKIDEKNVKWSTLEIREQIHSKLIKIYNSKEISLTKDEKAEVIRATIQKKLRKHSNKMEVFCKLFQTSCANRLALGIGELCSSLIPSELQSLFETLKKIPDEVSLSGSRLSYNDIYSDAASVLSIPLYHYTKIFTTNKLIGDPKDKLWDCLCNGIASLTCIKLKIGSSLGLPWLSKKHFKQLCDALVKTKIRYFIVDDNELFRILEKPEYRDIFLKTIESSRIESLTASGNLDLVKEDAMLSCYPIRISIFSDMKDKPIYEGIDKLDEILTKNKIENQSTVNLPNIFHLTS